MASNRQPLTTPLHEWFNNPWKTAFSAVFTIVSLFGIGYGVATHFCNQDFKIEKIELKQEYGEKVQNAINDCREGKMEKYEGEIKEIKATVDNLKKEK